jgi:predicted metalloprotease with PDZ domain
VVGLKLNTIGSNEMLVMPGRSYLGADLEDSGGFMSVRNVRAGSPAYDQGLNARDQIIALNGVRVNRDLFETLIAERKPGDTIHVTLFRDDNLRTLDIKLGSRVDAPYRIEQLPAMTEQQKRIYQSWLTGK